MPVVRPNTVAATPSDELRRVLRLQVPVIVKLAERRLAVGEVLRLGVGSIIEFAKRSDQPLDLLVNNRPIAVGEAVKVGENFGLRVKQVGTPAELLAALGE